VNGNDELNEDQLRDAARAIDGAAREESTGGAVDEAINTVIPPEDPAPAGAPADEPRPRGRYKKKSHKKGAGKTTREPKQRTPPEEPPPAGAPAGESAPGPGIDETFFRNAFASAVNAGVQLAKRSGWSSPGTKMVSEEDWVSAVAHCVDALRVKYLGDSIDEFQEEAALLLLVAPWAVANILRMLDERAKAQRASNHDARFNGKREEPQTSGVDTGQTQSGSGRSDDGQRELSIVGSSS